MKKICVVFSLIVLLLFPTIVNSAEFPLARELPEPIAVLHIKSETKNHNETTIYIWCDDKNMKFQTTVSRTAHSYGGISNVTSQILDTGNNPMMCK